MKHVVPHDLGQEKAKQVVVAALGAYEQKFAQYNPKSNWTSERRSDLSFSVKGMTLKGTLDVGPSTIELDLDVPFLLRPFRGTALGIIEQEIGEWIKKAKSGEL